MPVPYTFGSATASIPLSQLDSNFATAITIGNTAVQLGNTVTTLNNMTLANVTISSGNVTITNVSVTTANVSGTANVQTLAVVGNETIGGNSTITGNLTVANISESGNLTFTGTGNRITGDFTNATQTNRVAFQTSTTNGASALTVIPNGTATQSSINLFDNSDPTNAGLFNILSNSSEKSVRSTITGTGTYLPMTFHTGGSERIRIDTSGNVGIGTSSPAAKLDVRTAAGTAVQQNLYTGSNAASATLQFAQVGSVGWNTGITATTGDFQIDINTGGVGYKIVRSATAIDYHSWLTSGSERMRIDTNGNVGIGTSSIGAKLHLSGTDSAPTALRLQNTTATTGNTWQISSTNAGLLQLATRPGVADYMTVDSSGNVGIGTASGGDRLLVYKSGTGISSIKVSNDSTGFATFVNSSDAIAYNTGNGALLLGTNNTERMRIDSSGNVGIGNTTVRNKLDVVGNTGIYSTGATSVGSPLGAQVYIGDSNYNTASYYNAAPGFGAVYDATYASAAALAFYTYAGTTNARSERMRIDSSGFLLWATTNTSATAGAGVKFSLADTNNPVIKNVIQDSSGAISSYNLYSTNASAYRFYVTSTGVVNATSTTITAISDQRLKENIRDLDDGLEKVLALKPRKFDWKENKGENIKNARGFIAQELELVFPDMVTNWIDEPPEGEEPYKAVNANLIPTLVKAIQEQQALITALTARITALESK